MQSALRCSIGIACLCVARLFQQDSNACVPLLCVGCIVDRKLCTTHVTQQVMTFALPSHLLLLVAVAVWLGCLSALCGAGVLYRQLQP